MKKEMKRAYFADSDMVLVGTFGKSVGLHGALRVFFETDFKETLQNGTRFYIRFEDFARAFRGVDGFKGFLDSINASLDLEDLKDLSNLKDLETKKRAFLPITLKSYKPHNDTIKWYEFSTRDMSEALRNIAFYSTIEDTRRDCKLNDGEFFYFDIIGMEVEEDGETLGVIKDIMQIANTYYFMLEKDFLIPYIDRYVLKIDVSNKKIYTKDAKYLKMF